MSNFHQHLTRFQISLSSWPTNYALNELKRVTLFKKNIIVNNIFLVFVVLEHEKKKYMRIATFPTENNNNNNNNRKKH